MSAKIIFSAVLLAFAVAAIQPVLAGPKAHAPGKQVVTEQPAGLAPFRGDLHVYLKSF